MKKYIKATSNADILYIDIDINFVLVSTTDIAATKILPLRDGEKRQRYVPEKPHGRN